MAWIESHQTLREHPKTYALMDALGIEKPAVIGHLTMWWWWCLDFAKDGRMKPSAVTLARSADWKGNADTFANALLSVGWMDRDGDMWKIHDGDEYRMHYELSLEKKERQREQVRDRVKKWRDSRNVTPPVTRKLKRGNAPVTPSNAPTLPYRTVPDITVPDITQPEKKGAADAAGLSIPDDLLCSLPEITDWLEYKRQKGQTYKPKGLEALWRSFRAIPVDRRRETVDHSMANNYAGLFQKNGGQRGSHQSAGYAEAKPGKYPD